MESDDKDLNLMIAARLKAARNARGMTLDQLAQSSGVSRAMISKIERAEASPTAALLARLCATLGQSLSMFFAKADASAPLTRRADQPVWRDPQTGYLRRAVSSPGTSSRIDLVEVELPAGALVEFPTQPVQRDQWQYIWLFDGLIELTVGETVYRLAPGDCLYMTVGDVRAFRNPTDRPARYAVIIDLG